MPARCSHTVNYTVFLLAILYFTHEGYTRVSLMLTQFCPVLQDCTSKLDINYHPLWLQVSSNPLYLNLIASLGGWMWWTPHKNRSFSWCQEDALEDRAAAEKCRVAVEWWSGTSMVMWRRKQRGVEGAAGASLGAWSEEEDWRGSFYVAICYSGERWRRALANRPNLLYPQSNSKLLWQFSYSVAALCAFLHGISYQQACQHFFYIVSLSSCLQYCCLHPDSQK